MSYFVKARLLDGRRILFNLDRAETFIPLEGEPRTYRVRFSNGHAYDVALDPAFMVQLLAFNQSVGQVPDVTDAVPPVGS